MRMQGWQKREKTGKNSSSARAAALVVLAVMSHGTADAQQLSALAVQPLANAAASHATVSSQAAAAPRVNVRYEVNPSHIADALAAEGLHVSAEELHLPVALSATTKAPALRIISAELRHDDVLLLHLACRISAECMPFFASVTMADHVAAETALTALHGATGQQTGASPRVGAQSAASAGIAPGARVTLELADRQMRIQLPAIAIDTGQPGAEVRVASLDRKHTYRGVVVNAATVRGDLD